MQKEMRRSRKDRVRRYQSALIKVNGAVHVLLTQDTTLEPKPPSAGFQVELLTLLALLLVFHCPLSLFCMPGISLDSPAVPGLAGSRFC